MSRSVCLKIMIFVLFCTTLLAGAAQAQGPQPGNPAVPPNVGAPAPQATWYIEHVDTARSFADMGNRSLALDASGYPHIAYGGNRLYHRWWDGTAWQVETADNTPGVGRYTSTAVESAGQIHISYYDEVNGDLRYAYFALGAVRWFTCTVEAAGDVGLYSSLDVDSTGAAHIAYYDATNLALKYVYDSDGWWFPETVDSGYPVSGLALDLDGAGRPHIAYVEFGGVDYELSYAYFDGTSWHILYIDSGQRIAQPSLALDAAGHPHISYGKSFGGTVSLRHAYSDGAVWHHEIVDDVSGDTGYDSSLALDAAGNPHISYYDAANKALFYTYYDPGSDWWETTCVDNSAHVGKLSSLALGSNGTPHISYYDETNEDLKYTFYTCPLVCWWFVQKLDHSGYVGTYSSLALLNGQPRIAYYDEANGDLKYAYKDSTWHTLSVDLQGDVGSYASLVLDSDGDARISYHDSTNGALLYADEDGGYWWTDTVDSGTAMGLGTSIALDTNDWPHISYVDLWNDDLKYASEVGYGNGNCGPSNSWYCEIVAGAGDVDMEVTSLALDAAGRPHIAYVDWVAKTLKYAHYDGTSWQISTIASVGTFAGYPSLALDSTDQPHVTYCVETDPQSFACDELDYAYFDGTTWVTETVDSGGGSSSLAFDAAGRANVSYFDRTNGDLKYGYRFDWHGMHFWQTETVDSYAVVGAYSSLGIAPDGSLHISYFCTTAGDLCYAHTEVAPPPPPPVYRVYLPMLSRY